MLAGSERVAAELAVRVLEPLKAQDADGIFRSTLRIYLGCGSVPETAEHGGGCGVGAVAGEFFFAAFFEVELALFEAEELADFSELHVAGCFECIEELRALLGVQWPDFAGISVDHLEVVDALQEPEALFNA